ncbi:MAG: aconitase/3-isopropylmalate dehydratase large subunit family protein [Candidatus Thermoplasmatota archaeon]
MSKTVIQKIFESHSDSKADIDGVVDLYIDVRVARDFGGANVIKNLEEHNLSIDDPKKTFFTFDCNPGGCDQKYAINQHICRLFARGNNIKVFDVDSGIGTHIVFEEGLVHPGDTFVSTDSHANILGALCVFGQGMGDIDIAHAFAYGRIWFKVPPTIKIVLKGKPSKYASAKDIVLRMLKELGANGLLGYAAEIYGDIVDRLSVDQRITIASMATEMGGIITFLPMNKHVMDFYKTHFNIDIKHIRADPDAYYEKVIEIDIDGLVPQISKPGHPEDVVDVKDVAGTIIDSGFIGSCTNGRLEDMRVAAGILKGRRVADGRTLKIVPATDRVWRTCLHDGLFEIFKEAGALVGSAGCAGCANGQIGQTGVGEVAVSTGNRNFTGKQGKGEIFLASPETVAASIVAGCITTSNHIPERCKNNQVIVKTIKEHKEPKMATTSDAPLRVEGRAWVIKKDNIDTDMIYHNRYLSVTDTKEMAQYAFSNLKDYEHFAREARRGDIIIAGKNFGCGSSRQQAVDCFRSIGISVIIAESFGAIYERNAINSALPILVSEGITRKINNFDIISVDFKTGEIEDKTQSRRYQAKPFYKVQMDIYLRGGLLGG